MRVPASLLTRDAAARVMAPDHVFELARLRNAPAELTPVPLRLVMGSATLSPEPLTSIAAPEVTLVPVEVAPRAAADETLNTPLLTEVVPVYVFVPENTSVPLPPLVRVLALSLIHI